MTGVQTCALPISLNEFLRPEFINRVDEVISFNRLTEENFVEIARIMMNELKASMEEKGYSLSYDEELLKYLAGKSYSVTYGARNLRRLIQREVEDVITQLLIQNYASNVKMIAVTMRDGEVQVVTA